MLALSGRVYVDRVAGLDEAVGVEVGLASGCERRDACVRIDSVGGRREDRRALSCLGVGDPDHHASRQPGVAGDEDSAGLIDLMPEHPLDHLIHLASVQSGGVK
jgi:hypothetical protein